MRNYKTVTSPHVLFTPNKGQQADWSDAQDPLPVLKSHSNPTYPIPKNPSTPPNKKENTRGKAEKTKLAQIKKDWRQRSKNKHFQAGGEAKVLVLADKCPVNASRFSSCENECTFSSCTPACKMITYHRKPFLIVHPSLQKDALLSRVHRKHALQKILFVCDPSKKSFFVIKTVCRSGLPYAHYPTYGSWSLTILLTLAPFYPAGYTKSSQKWLLFAVVVS